MTAALIASCRFDARIPFRKLPPPPPVESPSPSGSASLSLSDGPSFSFGNITVGNTSDKIFTITNAGDGIASALTGTLTSGSFTYLGGAFPGTGGNCSSSLAASTSCTVVVRFAPLSSGAASDSVTLSYNNGTSSTTATRTLTGTGLSIATLTLSDAGYDYGSVSTLASADKTFTLINAGETTATAISDNNFVPGTDFDFAGSAYPGGGDCGSTLAGSATCTLIVRFTPSGLGAKNDTISLGYSTGVSSAAVTRAITGTGVLYGASGILDTTFSTDGKLAVTIGAVVNNDYAKAIVSQTDGKLIAGGADASSLALILGRFLSSGGFDTSFHTDGRILDATYSKMEAQDIGIGTDSKIVVAGTGFAGGEADNYVYRFLPNGNLDTTFKTNGISTVTYDTGIGVGSLRGASLVIQTDSKYITFGYGSQVLGNTQPKRLMSDGTLDTSFRTTGAGEYISCALGGGLGTGTAGKVRLFADGKFALIAWGGTTALTCLGKYHTNGTLDTSFNSSGKLTTTMTTKAYSLAIDSSFNVFAFGEFPSSARGVVVKFAPDGRVDTSFSTTGRFIAASLDAIYRDGLSVDGKVNAVGGRAAGGATFIRLTSNGVLDTSFATDGDMQETFAAFTADVAFGVTRRPTDNSLCAGGYDTGVFETQIFCVTP